ncbi:MAG: hypothetical protein RL071_106, partial [Pseudomonadota bacterium]
PPSADPAAALAAVPALARAQLGLRWAGLFSRSAGGAERLVAADPPGADPGLLPPDLLRVCLELDELVVIPDTAEAARLGGGAPWRALVALPLAPDQALVLADPAPHLPAPAALARLADLAALGGLAAAWLRERGELQRGLSAALSVQLADPHEAADPVDLISRALRGRALRLRGLRLRAPLSSRAPSPWFEVQPEPGAAPLIRPCPAPDPAAPGEGLEVAVVPPPHRAADPGLRAVLDEVADALRLALRLARMAGDQAAIARIATTLSSSQTAADKLRAVCAEVAARLDADGVKLIVLTEARGRRLLQQVFRTGAAAAEARPATLSSRHGLADWVILHDDWLNVVHAPPEADGSPGSAAGESGRHGPQRLRPRAAAELWTGAVADVERAQLLLPLRALDAEDGALDDAPPVVGALAVWREAPAPFDPAADRATLSALAPHVTAALARAIEQDRTDVELAALQALSAELDAVRGAREAGRRVLQQLLRISGGRHAILLLDEPERPGMAAVVAAASLDAPAARTRRLLDEGAVRWGLDPAARAAALDAALREQSGEAEEEEPGLPPRVQQLVPVSFGAHRGGLLLLRSERPLDAETARHRAGELLGVPLIARAATARAVRAFAPPALALLQRHLRQLEAACLSRVRAAAAPLEAAAAALREAFDADIAILAEGHGREHAARAVFVEPGLPEALRRALHGRTLEPPEEGARSARSADLFGEDSVWMRSLDRALLHEPTAHTGRPVRSWLRLPVRANNHLHGVLHLMRLEGSGAFGPEVEEVAERVLDEAARLRRQAELAALRAELDQLVRELTGAPADALTAALPGRLEAHLRRALGRSCAVAVRAREGGRALFSCASTALSSTDLDELEALSAALGAAEDRRARPAHAGRGALGRGAALALPITLGSDPDLHGHLFVLRPPDFDAEDAERARELARAVALLLEGEALRSRWKLQAGLFRHALLGPAQGLQSAARKLALLARLPDPPLAEVDEADQRVQIESAALRTWQRNQRALAMVQAGQPPDLRPRDAALRPLLERCARRYEAAFAERGASLRWAWGTGTGLRFPFDEDALDVMFTNLLDNASKYGFYNRPVTVGVEIDGPAVALWVESLGAAIPQGVAQGLYLPGARLAARDPLRAIHGEGLGLFLVGLLATAAGGEVSHACAPEGEDRGPTSPHRVRFTLRLPHRWTARKPRPG